VKVCGRIACTSGFIDEVIRFPRGSIQGSMTTETLPKQRKNEGISEEVESGEYDSHPRLSRYYKSALFSKLVKEKG
jgi:hypothetical protein